MTTIPDEESPLLNNGQPKTSVKTPHTPLPLGQFSIVLFLQLAEPLTAQVIYPFTPELIRSLDIAKDEAEVGYYVGIMQSLFYATQALTVLHWSRLSDHIGRKPVILIGLAGLAVSMYCFGLSKTFWSLVLSRCLNGFLNGNVGVLKSVLAEMCDQTNLSVAYGYLPIAWSTGGTLGPLIGGALSRPAERFPNVFGNSQFLKDYPYFLPCAIPATFTVVAWFVTYKFLNETLPSPISIRQLLGLQKKHPDLTVSATEVDESLKPFPIRKLLIRSVLIPTLNYALLALVDSFIRAVQPLFFSTPIALGGLGLSPPVIGTILSLFGILNAIFQVFFFAKLNDKFGSKNLFIVGILSAIPCFLLFPGANALARQAGGLNFLVWSAVGLQVLFCVLINLCYGSIFIYIAASAPNKASLGATNGLGQLLCSIVRAVGPALIDSLFSLSIDEKHHYLNGWLVYFVALAVTGIAVAASSLLPRKVWKDKR